MNMPRQQETVYERSKRTGFISGPDHNFARGPAKKAAAEKPKPTAKPTLQGPSLDDLRKLVSDAVAEKFAPAKGKKTEGAAVELGGGVWVKDLVDDHAIVEHKGGLKGVPFTVKGGKVTLGDAFAVEQQYVAV